MWPSGKALAPNGTRRKLDGHDRNEIYITVLRFIDTHETSPAQVAYPCANSSSSMAAFWVTPLYR